MKKIFTLTLLVIILTECISCARSITPYEAANGHARCGRSLR
ncbi:MAG TPA: hypothetical protein VK705_09395 [Ferruginibacter sp.]|nr:hypothetical protein [Ferruginibacter sp.]